MSLKRTSQRFALLAFVTIGSLVASRADFHVVELPSVPGNMYSQSLSINDQNVVVGLSFVGAASHATLWDGSARDIHPPSVLGSSACSSINNSGIITLTAGFKAYRYENGNYLVLSNPSSLPNSYAAFVNNEGDIVGGAFNSTQVSEATWWAPEFAQGSALGKLNGSSKSNAFAINDSLDIVGDCIMSGTPVAAYFQGCWKFAGNMPTPGSINTVTNRRLAGGRIEYSGQRPALWNLNNTGLYRLPISEIYQGGQVFGLNDSNFAVGAGTELSGSPRGVYWTEDQGMQEFNSHLYASDGEWSIVDARSINKYGVIAASATKNGRQYAIILQPDTMNLAPDSMSVNMGRWAGGTLTSLQQFDGDSVQICKSVVPNLTVSPIQIVVTTVTPKLHPTLILINALGKMGSAGSFQMSSQLYNFDSQNFDSTVSTAIGLAGTSLENIANAEPGLPLSRYVESQTGSMKAKISIKTTGLVPSPNWCFNLDQVEWRINY